MEFFLKAVERGAINPLYINSPNAPSFEALVDLLYAKKWVVYVKDPFKSPKNLFKYIARYTHRIAISNQRILNVENNCVTFAYKDYADNGKRKTMTIKAVEFIRRFMLHILPKGFMRIRQYGFLSNKVKKNKLNLIRKLLKDTGEIINTSIDTNKWKENTVVQSIFECPECKNGTLIKLREITAKKYVQKMMVNH